MSICREDQGRDAPRLRVAVIDDEPLILSLMGDILKTVCVIGPLNQRQTMAETSPYDALWGRPASFGDISVTPKSVKWRRMAQMPITHTVFSESGHSVACFTSPVGAMAALDESTFDVVLCDINMPEMTGIEFYQRLSVARPEYGDRFVFLAGDLSAATTQRFLARTGCMYLSKPFRRAALESVLTALATPGASQARPNELRKAA